MDAREYLTRKGLDGSRDEERPNTLGEKAWERARHSSGHQPRAGTPYDWEDWERYHDELAKGAESIEQKIEHEAHRQEARSRVSERGPDRAVVQHFEPPQEARSVPSAAQVNPQPTPWQASVMLRFSFRALAVLLPPLAVGLAQGSIRRIGICLLLTLLGWLPGSVYAWSWLNRQQG